MARVQTTFRRGVLLALAHRSAAEGWQLDEKISDKALKAMRVEGVL